MTTQGILRGLVPAAVAGLLFLAGCSSAPPPESKQAEPPAPQFKPVVSVNQVMVSVIDHNAHILWDVELKGKNAPKKDSDWHALEHAAVTLASIGNIVMMGGTGTTDGVWAKDPKWQAHAQDTTNAALEALSAIQKKDVNGVLASGDKIVIACEGCHKDFKPALPKIRATKEEQAGH